MVDGQKASGARGIGQSSHRDIRKYLIKLNILVTGDAGFIGSHVAEQLALQGHAVRVVDALTDTYCTALKLHNLRQLQDRGIAFVKADLAEDDLATAVAGTEFVFHVAGQPGINNQLSSAVFARNNVLATQRLLNALVKPDALRGFIYVSTSSVYGADACGDESSVTAPTSDYGVSKLVAERLVLRHATDHRLRACALRLYSVYGPRERPEKLYMRLIGSLLEDRPFPLFDGSLDHLRSYTYVDDVVAGLIAAMHHIERCAGEIFNLGTATATSTRDAISTAETLLGKRARLVATPHRAGEQRRTHANIDKAQRYFGYAPRTPLEAGLAQQIAWYRRVVHGRLQLWQ